MAWQRGWGCCGVQPADPVLPRPLCPRVTPPALLPRPQTPATWAANYWYLFELPAASLRLPTPGQLSETLNKSRNPRNRGAQMIKTSNQPSILPFFIRELKRPCAKPKAQAEPRVPAAPGDATQGQNSPRARSCLREPVGVGAARGGCRRVQADDSPWPSCLSARSFLSPGSKLVRKAIIVLNKMHLLRGGQIRISSLFERGYNL